MMIIIMMIVIMMMRMVMMMMMMLMVMIMRVACWFCEVTGAASSRHASPCLPITLHRHCHHHHCHLQHHCHRHHHCHPVFLVAGPKCEAEDRESGVEVEVQLKNENGTDHWLTQPTLLKSFKQPSKTGAWPLLYKDQPSENVLLTFSSSL